MPVRGPHRHGCGGSTPPSCRAWVASIAAMQRSLKPQSTGRHRGDPPFPASVAQIIRASSASNGGACRRSSGRAAPNLRRVSPPISRGVPLRTGEVGGGTPSRGTNFIFGGPAQAAPVAQRRGGGFKPRTSVSATLTGSTTACGPMQRRSAQAGKVAGASPATRTNLECQPDERAGPRC